MNKNRGLTPLAVVLMLSGSVVLTGCDDKPSQQGQQQAPEVGVVTLKTEPLQVTTELPGRTSSYRIAEVRPQVSGIILKRNFVEGSDIKAGESLYQIDPATYQAAYDSAKGDLAQAQANAQIAALTVKRYKPLLGTQYISKQEYDQAVATQSQTAAAVEAAKAAVETARINLAYTKVTSPISGRIGKSTVTEGALVQNGQTNALSTVQQLDPIYVDVTQSSNEFLRLKEELASGKLKQENGKAKVTLLLQDSTTYPQQGTLEFSDVTVDESTGSLTLRAIFPNPNSNLLPGMFVRARLDEGVNPTALLVPQQGVTRTPTGDASALVVNKENKVETRKLTAAQAIGDKWLVTEGLKAGDRVIVSGLQRVKPGATVTPQEVNDDAKSDANSAQDTGKAQQPQS
ncbi:efflux RND transporter periplasmic adaptor subunit [Pantoea sp. 1.19]|uniref:efflux RND transporter periplasmic adaptor subunit n=1 Tax=Pantoea sp. 1.19 TaxID=1925589 RepID=UPI000948B74C|nr:efflux RND transporter periplasmic adaptor subunit [Pantoea sp. 1.19]